MTTGDLDGDGMDELVVGAGAVKGRTNNVHIYDGSRFSKRYVEERLNQGAPGVCTGTVLPAATLTPSAGEYDIACGRDCGYGEALAIGDIATDDNGPELAVGARSADVEGETEAGAVYIYRGWQRSAAAAPGAGGAVFDQFKLASQVFDSTPKSGNNFGASVAIAPMAGRNELLIGVSGTGKVVVAFCTGVGEDIEAGGDVTRDKDGKVISTRCRL